MIAQLDRCKVETEDNNKCKKVFLCSSGDREALLGMPKLNC